MATTARDARAATRASTRPQAPRPPMESAFPPRPNITVVVPTLNEAGNVRRAVKSALNIASTSARVPEVIVVDGGSVDDTVSRARAAGALVLSAPKGRASQCNVGAKAAKGVFLLFLHADSTLPPQYDVHVDRAFSARNKRGRQHEWGAFRFALGDGDSRGNQSEDEDDALVKPKKKQKVSRQKCFSFFDACAKRAPRRILETAVNIRTAVFSRPYGDQGLIVRKSTFEALGGFARMPFLEDVEFVSRLKNKYGAPAMVRAPVTTSSRRFDTLGYVRTSLLNQTILAAYTCGVSVERLQRWYTKARIMGGETREAVFQS
jgi:glycosyltransferase involved in cell wall biosynthesis